MRPALRGWLAILPLVAWSGCGGGNGVAPGASVTGAWCGLQVTAAADCTGDNEPIYAELAQSGTTVTGRSCEYYLAGCYAIENGSLTGTNLVFDYTFSPDRVDANLDLSADSQTLTGTYASTKCSCDVPVTLHRLP